jgi:hypothetical protein
MAYGGFADWSGSALMMAFNWFAPYGKMTIPETLISPFCG